MSQKLIDYEVINLSKEIISLPCLPTLDHMHYKVFLAHQVHVASLESTSHLFHSADILTYSQPFIAK